MQVKLPDWGSCLFDLAPRYFAIHGGRGSGKTRTVATVLLLRASERCLRVLCARQIQKSIKDSVKRVLDDEIERLGLGWFYTSTETEIRGANGSLFIFAGLQSNIDSIKSMEGVDICWVDEAQSVKKEALEILVPTIRKPGSQFYFTWNPKSPKDPVDAKFCGADPPPGSVVLKVNYVDNPWFPEVLRVEMEYDRGRDPTKYNHIWLGNYLVLTEALIFKNWKIEDFEAPATAIHRLGADWGYAVDPSVLIRGHQVGRSLFVDYEAWQIGCEIEDLPSLFLSVPASEKWPIVADSSRPETISHVRRHGFPKLMPAVKGPGSIEDGIEFLKGFDIIVHPRCTHVIDELSTYSWKIDPKTGEILPKPADENNHTMDSLRYMCEGARRLKATQRKAPAPPTQIASRW
jgi:phage terminase large subunit